MKAMNRRQFVGDTAKAAAGLAAGAWAAGDLRAASASAPETAADPSRILNYNPQMEYRRLGKTGLMVSAVCLGGHTRCNQKERTEIISRAIDLGINYIDACWDNEVKRDARALKGRRDRMYLALSHGAKEVRNENYRTAKKLLQSLDELLRDSGQEYTDLWRITCLEPGGRHTFNTACEIVEALTTAKKQGKARHIGFSSHDRRWIKFMIEYFPEIEVVCFPFTTMSKAAPRDSLFPALKKCDVGAFGIKPFAAGSLFTGNREEDLKRARLALRYILYTNTVIPIPGINRMEELENAVLAVRERRQFDLKEQAALEQMNREVWAALPGDYQWLRRWEYV
ncbi:MAG: aldo/keto reductase [Verrucomicrobia bacterium]|nr:MAG: aldo/keto reductase [Verrucomicrobiota bacterium]